MIKAKEFLIQKLIEEYRDIGKLTPSDIEFLHRVAEAFMNDRENSKHRFDIIIKYMPQAHKILDMASGAGTSGFYGLLNGYDCYGIDPSNWKFEFLQMKINEYNYPKEWINKFTLGYGESMPYRDSEFDFVSSYQTLEHCVISKSA